MDFIDIIIIVAIIFFAIVGFNNGVFKSLLNIIGFLLSLYVAYLLKNSVVDILILNLPFFQFGSLLSIAPSLNILLYQILALILLITISELLFNVIISVLGLGDRLLKLTMMLRVPAKILGIFAGAIEGYIIVFLCVFVLSQPFVDLKIINNSNVAKTILRETPVLSNWNRDFINVFDGLNEILNEDDEVLTDVKVSELLLNEKMVSKESFKKLLELRKLDGYNEEMKKLVE